MPKRTDLLKHLPGLLIGALVLVLCALINPSNHYFSALLLIVCAVFLYFYIAVVPAKGNWWDMRAVFAAIWIATIGLASLRLTNYQRQWETSTWLILALAYGMFYIGVTLGLEFGAKLLDKIRSKPLSLGKKYSFQLHENRLFWVCFGATLFGIVCFAANVAVRGYIPYFAKKADAYLDFYTKFYIFSVAATMISGLSYYTLKTQTLSLWKKIFLWFSIVYSTFLFPMLVISRGAFLTSALALTTALFYLNKKRFLLLVLSAIVIVTFYMEGTKARGYSDAQLNAFFEPSVITMNNATSSDSSTSTGDGQTDSDDPNTVQFQLSGTAAFVYSYLTVSHDNFNEAVRLTEDYSYGIRQLLPFNVILRSSKLEQAIDNSPYYLVRPHLNTVNLVGYAYYDFGIAGVGILMLLWAIAFGMIQAFVLKDSGPFALMALGNTMTPVVLCCFAPWMSVFSNWMHWGFAFILFLIATISKKSSSHSGTNI